MNDSTTAFPASSAVPPVAANARLAERPHGNGLVSWGAIVAGAAGAAALSLILLILGVGLGLSSVSPWVARGASASAMGVATILWLTLTQLAASGMGGYLAGRLRTRWAGTDPDEVHFRDTAHGFLAWAVATLATAALLGSAVGTIVGGGAQVAASAAGGAATAAAAATAGMAGSAAASTAGAAAPAKGDGTDYFVDALMRRDAAAPATSTTSADGAVANPGEAGRILASAMAAGALPADDARHLGRLVAARTGLPQADADKRVSDTFARMQARAQAAEAAARDAADKARKASATSALWIFVSLLGGAFFASLMATFGGRRRDLF